MHFQITLGNNNKRSVQYLVTFIEEILNGKNHFLYSGFCPSFSLKYVNDLPTLLYLIVVGSYIAFFQIFHSQNHFIMTSYFTKI